MSDLPKFVFMSDLPKFKIEFFYPFFGIVLLGIGGCDRPSALSTTTKSALAKAPERRVKGIEVRTDRPLLPLSPHPVGMNLHVTNDAMRPGTVEMIRRTKARIVRWPGGSESDIYQWRTHRLTPPWYAHPNSSFDRFMRRLAQPAQVEVAITLNYGSNATGKGGGDPAEAAAWVADAKAKGYRVPFWTVGNEVFGTWSTDLNEKPHDAATYARKVANAFYPKIKAVNPQARVGVVVNQYDTSNPHGWTQTVLRRARYDFVEVHHYPQEPNSGSDEFLLTKAVPQFKAQMVDLKKAMGDRPVPILIGEFNNVASKPNRQTLSIVNALYHGLMYAEGAQLGLAGVFPWETIEDYCTHPAHKKLETGDFNPKLYGWQNFSTYSLFSLGLPSNSPSCSRSVPVIPFGTAFPTARAAALFGEFAAPRERLLQTNIAAAFPSLRAYAATRGKGYRLLLFNLNSKTAAKLPLQLRRAAGPWKAQQVTYGKAEYDKSRYGFWVEPTRQDLGRIKSGVQVNLPPWSMSVIALDR
ncbi:hypothetical protein [Altericista sp. CCNU0014]|uniref:hypothetical protein n=1 Tax=Altericista sp. CCNU0014 TaxID=3082949 RepID=UPI00384F4EAE